jgi:hypothetical protein
MPLIALNVVIHVFCLATFTARTERLLSRFTDHRNFILTFAVVMGIAVILVTLLHVLEAGIWAIAYRYIGAYHFLAGDIDLARRWFRSGIELDPAFDWDVSELDVGHPLRRAFDEERNAGGAKSELVAGKMLNVAAGSSLSLDGRPLKKPSATPGRPHLVQVVGDDDQSVRKTYLIDGNNFPAELLQDESMAAAVPSEDKGKGKGKPKGGGTSVTSANPNDAYAVQQVQRVRPKAKTPMLISGGVVALGAIEELGDSLDLGGWMYTLDEVHTVDITLDSAAIASLNANPWADVHAGLVFDEAWTFPDVALRIKGRLGSYRALTGKSGFKVDLNEFVPGENIDGVTLLNLNNMVQDNSQVHELMVYEAFRLVGLAAPRVGYVWVTVNGAPYGLYTNVEAYDQNSLRRNYADGTGNLYDGDYYMPVWGSYTMIDFDTATQDLFQQDEGVDIGRLDIHGVTAAVADSAGTESFD